MTTKKIKRKFILKIRNESIADRMGPLFQNQLFKKFEKHILDGTMDLDQVTQKVKNKKGKEVDEEWYVLTMEGTKEQVDEWTKIGFKDKAIMRPFKKWIDFEVIDL